MEKFRKALITGVLAGLVIWIVGIVLSGATASLVTQQFVKPIDPIGMLINDIIVGILFAAIYTTVQTSIPGSGWGKGLEYGFLIWAVSTLPEMLATYSTIVVPASLIFTWILDGLVAKGLMGIVIGASYDKV